MQLGWHPVPVLQYTFAHKQYIEQHNPHKQYIEQHNRHKQYVEQHNPHKQYIEQHNPHKQYIEQHNPHKQYIEQHNPHKQYIEQHISLIRKSGDRAPSLRGIPWHLPYNGWKSTEIYNYTVP
jgi:hypothetical protein